MFDKLKGKGPKRTVANALLFVTVIFMSALGPAVAGHAADHSHPMVSGSDIAYPA